MELDQAEAQRGLQLYWYNFTFFFFDKNSARQNDPNCCIC